MIGAKSESDVDRLSGREAMATTKTAAEIKAHLKDAIEASAACRGTRCDGSDRL